MGKLPGSSIKDKVIKEPSVFDRLKALESKLEGLQEILESVTDGLTSERDTPEVVVSGPDMAKLKDCMERVATLTGNGNVLAEFGLKRWTPGKKDLHKYG